MNDDVIRALSNVLWSILDHRGGRCTHSGVDTTAGALPAPVTFGDAINTYTYALLSRNCNCDKVQLTFSTDGSAPTVDIYD